MIRGVLIDLGGVVYSGGAMLPGAAQALARLKSAGLPFRFITNTTSKPRSALVAQLAGYGVPVEPAHVFAPAQAARAWLGESGHRAHLLIAPALAEDFAGSPAEGPEAVVVGDAGRGFTYDALNVAFRKLLDGAPLIALAENRRFRDVDGGLSLDAGPFVRALEYASGAKARLMGKPARDFFAAAATSMGLDLADCAMIGDDAEADVAGALRAGVGLAVLVRTGKYRPGDEAAHDPAPSHVAADLGGAVDWLLQRD